MPSAGGREKKMHTQSGARVRGALSEARAGVQRLRTAAAPVSLTFARAGASLAIRNRGGLIFYPRAKANSFLGAVSLSLRSLPLCSLPSPSQVLGPRPLGVRTSPPPPPRGFLRRGGKGVGEGQRQKPGGGDGGGDEGKASCLLESPGVVCSSSPGLGPGALCWLEPRAPAAAGARCGGREGAA